MAWWSRKEETENVEPVVEPRQEVKKVTVHLLSGKILRILCNDFDSDEESILWFDDASGNNFLYIPSNSIEYIEKSIITPKEATYGYTIEDPREIAPTKSKRSRLSEVAQ